jgi:nitrate reductase NapD
VNIAGVLVHAQPGAQDALRADLARLPGVEVHEVIDDHRLIITVEDEGEQKAADTLLAVHRLTGVLSASLVYHHFEPDAPDA